MGDRKHAVDLLNSGIASLSDKSNPQALQHAYQCISSACLVDPTFSDAFYQNGNTISDLNLFNAAVAYWRRGLQCETTSDQKSKILGNMSWRLLTLGRIEEALQAGLQSVEVDPKNGYCWITLANIYQILDDAEKSADAARKSYALMPDDPLVEFGLGLALLFNRELVEGFNHLEARFPYKLKNYLQYPYPKWDGTAGKTVFLSADQGLGDTLSFARFVPMLCEKSKYVHAAIQPELMRLFVHVFNDIRNLNLIPNGQVFPAADAWTTFVSLPNALGLDDATIRNTKQIEISNWQIPLNWKVPDRKIHIGIAWAGSPLNNLDMHRSIPVHEFYELYRVPGVQLYSLQVGDRAKEIGDSGGSGLVRELGPYLRDVADTFAVLSDLDLVIGCESALGHICAATGKEFWLLYSYLGRDYRLGLDTKDMLWTPKHRIFRQGKDRQWGPVFEQIIEALKEMLDVSKR